MSAVDKLSIALDALEQIAMAGMSGSGQESPEGMRDWHARRAWEFIGIAARALEEVKAASGAGEPAARQDWLEKPIDWHLNGVPYTHRQAIVDQCGPVALAYVQAAIAHYTTPPAAVSPLALTDEKIDEMAEAAFEGYMTDQNDDYDRALARTVEKHHGIVAQKGGE